MNNAIMTFTCNSAEDIVSSGGDYDWPVDLSRVKSCQYLVCTSSVGSNHRSGFLVGKISGIEKSKVDEHGRQRYIIRIAEKAIINIPNLWDRKQNPVRYSTLDKLGIDLFTLQFEKINSKATSGISIAQAKVALSLHYGVSQDSIEIAIKA